MPNTNTDLQRRAAFYHSIGKVHTYDNNSVSNEKYKSSHNVLASEIWMDTIPFSPNSASSSQISDGIVVRQIGTFSSPGILYPLNGTAFQSWFLDTGTPSCTSAGCVPSTGWCKPLINPSDVPNEAGAPSFGFELLIYNKDISGNVVPVVYSNTGYEVDYFAGIVRFQTGLKPTDSVSNSGLNRQFDNVAFAASGDKFLFLQDPATSGGPIAVAWQYVGQTLAEYEFSKGLTAGDGLTISNGIISISVDSGLTFSENSELIVNIDNQSIKINSENKIYVSGNSVYEWNYSFNTSGDDQPTGFTISNTPLNYSTVEVMINGQVQILGGINNYTNSDCYFYSGSAVRDIDDIVIGDELYWNGLVTGYNLSTDDKILLIYEI